MPDSARVAIERPRAFQFGCILLFVTPFGLAGLRCLGMLAAHLQAWWTTRDWVEVPCRILTADLEVHSDGEGTSYKAVATYEYEFAGRKRRGDRVWLNSRGDGVGGFLQRLHRTLEQHRANGVPYRCFVNPHSPDESVINRDLRIRYVVFLIPFIMVFGGFGVAGWLGTVHAARAVRRRRAAAARHPDEPWKWEEQHAEGVFLPERTWFKEFAIAYICNAIAWPVAVVFAPELEGPLALVPAFFPAIGLWLAVKVYRSWRKEQRHGRPALTIAPWPYFAGDALCGTIAPLDRSEWDHLVTVELQVVTPNSDGPDRVHYQSQQTIDGGESVAFRFPPQYDVPSTTRLWDDVNSAHWRIRVKSSDRRRTPELEYDVLAFSRDDRGATPEDGTG